MCSSGILLNNFKILIHLIFKVRWFLVITPLLYMRKLRLHSPWGHQDSNVCAVIHFLLCWSLVQFSSVPQSCPALCDPMDHSMPGFPVHHQLSELAQIHVHWINDAIRPSHPLSSPSPAAFNLSQHQGLFQWVIGSQWHNTAFFFAVSSVPKVSHGSWMCPGLLKICQWQEFHLSSPYIYLREKVINSKEHMHFPVCYISLVYFLFTLEIYH